MGLARASEGHTRPQYFLSNTFTKQQAFAPLLLEGDMMLPRMTVTTPRIAEASEEGIAIPPRSCEFALWKLFTLQLVALLEEPTCVGAKRYVVNLVCKRLITIHAFRSQANSRCRPRGSCENLFSGLALFSTIWPSVHLMQRNPQMSMESFVILSPLSLWASV